MDATQIPRRTAAAGVRRGCGVLIAEPVRVLEFELDLRLVTYGSWQRRTRQRSTSSVINLADNRIGSCRLIAGADEPVAEASRPARP